MAGGMAGAVVRMLGLVMGDQEKRSRKERIARLKRRLDHVQTATVEGAQLVSVLKGLLDLLDDEL